jgi:hypothetical protein
MNRKQLPALLLAGMLAGITQADPNPYYLGASLGWQHDSNLLRLGDNQAAPAGRQKADSITTVSLLAGLDQSIGRQHLFGNLTAGHNSLANNPIYNNNSYTLATGLDWETAKRISGTLRYNASRNLAQFNADLLGLVTTQSNIQNSRQFNAGFKLGMDTEFSFDAGAGHKSVDYSATAYASRVFREDSLSLGMHYKPSAVSLFGVSLRNAKGRYPTFFANGDGTFDADRFTRRDIDFTAFYRASGVSSFSARVSPGKISYDISSVRDFSGITGQLLWDWQPAGKLHLRTSLMREPGQDSYFFASLVPDSTVEYSRISNSANLRADYELSAKISLSAKLGWIHRSLTQQLDPFGVSISGSEQSTLLSLGAVWTPLRSLQLSCNLSNQRRGGAAPLSSDLRDTTVSCYAQGTIQ